jgi:hypothetical protein
MFDNFVRKIGMKARKKATIAIAFALMALTARPQIMFAQTAPIPIRGSWDRAKSS